MMDNAGSETLQLSILRATVASGTIPEKERAIMRRYLQTRQINFL